MPTTNPTNRESSDAELVEASASGSLGAFGELIQRHENAVCAIAFAATGDRALSEDIGQETFVAAWKKLDRVEEPDKTRGWLCGTARNLSKMALRKRRREVASPNAGASEHSSEPSPLDAAIASEQQELVAAALREIPETYREPLVLFYSEEKSVKQVASGLGLSEEAVRQRLSRGRTSLKDGVASVLEKALAASRPKKAFGVGVLAILAIQIGTGATAHAGVSSSSSSSSSKLLWLGGFAALAVAAAVLVSWGLGRDQSGPPSTPTVVPASPGEPLLGPVSKAGSHSATWLALQRDVDVELAPERPAIVVEIQDMLGGAIGGAAILEDGKLRGTTNSKGLARLS